MCTEKSAPDHGQLITKEEKPLWSICMLSLAGPQISFPTDNILDLFSRQIQVDIF